MRPVPVPDRFRYSRIVQGETVVVGADDPTDDAVRPVEAALYWSKLPDNTLVPVASVVWMLEESDIGRIIDGERHLVFAFMGGQVPVHDVVVLGEMLDNDLAIGG